MNGLAQQSMEQQVDPAMVAQVKQALMQGASPEELIQQGVPQEVIEAAIAELQAEMQQGQQQSPVTLAGQGLAGQYQPMM